MIPGRLISVTILVLAGSLAGGCAAQPVWTSPPGSERFQVGYHAGCEDGLAIAGNSAYDRISTAEPDYQDPDFVHGWQSGFIDCKRKQDRIQATLHSMFGNGS